MVGDTRSARPLALVWIGAGLTALQWISLIFAGWLVSVYSATLPELWKQSLPDLVALDGMVMPMGRRH
ncbi:MAG: hypothetical protein NXI27_22050 [Alphaproteobacteria bacterium]|nr:hypothetical protein [Alphaproteobacteria bacterium]